jgi:hypothetical protein
MYALRSNTGNWARNAAASVTAPILVTSGRRPATEGRDDFQAMTAHRRNLLARALAVVAALALLVAVDFYRAGDVFKVVDTLNGVGPATP